MKILLPTLIAITLAISASAVAQDRGDAKPNILFILSDDHSYPFLSCYGDTNVKTPALDRFAAEGMKFHRFFTAAPQCVPSRASLLTGRSPVAARITRFSSPLARDEITFPEVLRKRAGYFTGVCGRAYHLDGSGARSGNAIGELLEKHGMHTFEQRLDYVKQGSDGEALEQMKDFLARKPADKPFCLWLNFSDPHHPWNAPESDRPDPASLKLPAHWPDLPGMRRQLADYCAEVNRLDRSVAAVLALLDGSGFAKNTVVVFCGDNGAALPHGKGSLYDPGCNVPFLVRWPGVVKAGGESRALLSGEDLAPTLLAAAGLTAPAKMSGVNFLPLLKSEPYTARRYIFTERGPHGSAPVAVNMKNGGYDLSRAVRSEHYKFIYNCTPWIPYSPVDSSGGAGWQEMTAASTNGSLAPGLTATYFTSPRPVYELYDLDADPSELKNLSGQAELAATERELRLALAEKMIVDFDYLPLPAIADAEPRRRGKAKVDGASGNRGAQFRQKDPDTRRPVKNPPPTLLSRTAGPVAVISPVPGTVIHHQPAATGLYIGSPSLCVLPDGSYLASHDLFGPGSKEYQFGTGRIYRSTDRGETWKQITDLKGFFWSNLFLHRGAAYAMGTDKHHGRLVIRRSDDSGKTWSAPAVIADGQWHTAPVPVVEHGGRLWRAVEDAHTSTKWGERYRARMVSIPVGADLLLAANWTFSNPLARDPAWLEGRFAAWLEGNAVVDPQGGLVNLLRVDKAVMPEHAAMVRISPDGTTATFDPNKDFIGFPGGAKKFTIRMDPAGAGYWTITSIVLPEDATAGHPAAIRNTLALGYSKDLRNWEIRCLLLRHTDVAKHGFQYVDWQFEGDDLIAACRTAWDDADGGARNNHDANYLTFHRWPGFRKLTRADDAPLPEIIPVVH